MLPEIRQPGAGLFGRSGKVFLEPSLLGIGAPLAGASGKEKREDKDNAPHAEDLTSTDALG
jgi:hypothetical protein